MDESLETNFIELVDEDGEKHILEYVDTLESEGSVYMAFLPTIDSDEEDEIDLDEKYGLIILKVVADQEEEQELITIEDPAELERVYSLFMESFLEDENPEEPEES